MSGRALAWAQRQPVTGCARAVLSAIAWLADSNGVAVASNEWLAEYTHVSVRSVQRAFKVFEEKQLLVRVLRVDERNKSRCPAIYLNLENKPVRPKPQVKEMTQPIDFEALKIASLRPESRAGANGSLDMRSLGQVLADVLQDGFNSANRQELADILVANADSRIKLYDMPHVTQDEIISAAWEIIHRKTAQIARSKQPWKYLSVAIKNAVTDTHRTTSPEVSYSPDLLDVPEQSELPGEHALNSDAILTYDDFGNKTHTFINILISAGIAEPLAWAITRRGLEIVALKGRDNWYHTHARADSELASYGLTPGAAAEFMNLFVGKRSKRIPKEQWSENTAFFSSKLNLDDYRSVEMLANTLKA